jgi:hypothetical protein
VVEPPAQTTAIGSFLGANLEIGLKLEFAIFNVEFSTAILAWACFSREIMRQEKWIFSIWKDPWYFLRLADYCNFHKKKEITVAELSWAL